MLEKDNLLTGWKLKNKFEVCGRGCLILKESALKCIKNKIELKIDEQIMEKKVKKKKQKKG